MPQRKRPTDAELEVLLPRIEAALTEFHRTGNNTVARCDRCEGLIEVTSPGPEVWSLNCPCGRYKDTLRGL